jgi:NADP-dependent 3-hydroxy acid dehydrogenase YdfG
VSDPAARTAFVTGASSGIGAATARALGASGYAVALGARRSGRLEEVAKDVERAGGRAFCAVLDVRDACSIDGFFDAAEAALGPPGVVVSNAGVGFARLLAEYSEEELRSELDTNLLGPMLVARRAAPGMMERGGGDLIFVSSLNVVSPRTFQAGYTASKAGLEGFVRVLQMELEGSGVRASVVRPGPTGSEFGADYGAERSRRMLASWKHWGTMRELHWMAAERVADAIVTVAMTPPGTHLDVVQVVPVGTRKGPL